VTEVVPAPEPPPRPTLSPDPEQTWRPGPRRIRPEEIGPPWRRWEAAHIVLGLIALVIVVMVIMVVALVLNR
jgi:hypothetical protein